MRVHFDVTHPAHVHLFRPAIQTLADRGHTVAVTSRDKEVTTDLLDACGIDHAVLSTKRSSQLALAPEWGLRTLRTLRFVRAFEPDVVVSQFNPSAVIAAACSDATSIVFHDSETAGKLADVIGPLADEIYSPVGVAPDLGDHHESYEGFHELAYLHPERFEFDPNVLEAHGVDADEPYTVLRTVSMGAYHDVGAEGLSGEETRRLATELAEHGDVYVSSEAEPPEDLPAEPVPVPPADVHHLLAGASAFVGDSDTMAIEAGILGTPSVRVNCFGEGTLGCFDELERYDLVDSFTDDAAAVDRAVELAADPDAGERWDARREELLADKVDVTAFMLERIRAAAGEPTPREGAGDAEQRTPAVAGAAGATAADGERQSVELAGRPASDDGAQTADGGGAETDDASEAKTADGGGGKTDDAREAKPADGGDDREPTEESTEGATS